MNGGNDAVTVATRIARWTLRRDVELSFRQHPSRGHLLHSYNNKLPFVPDISVASLTTEEESGRRRGRRKRMHAAELCGQCEGVVRPARLGC